LKILAFSDTHNKHNDILFNSWIEDYLKEHSIDVIICCGDFSTSQKSFDNFISWYAKVPVKNKLLIAGNHDEVLEKKETRDSNLLFMKEEGLIYLEDNSIIIDSIKFYGTPWTPIFMNWNFMGTENQLKKKFEKIDEDTHVLISHGPPYGILDVVKYNLIPFHCVGSTPLAEKIGRKLKDLKLHVFGHVHEDYGMIEKYGITFANVSTLNKQYEVVNKIQFFEI
jgi:Icc-related predicted phosphoesterase